MKVTADDIAQLLASSPPRQVPAHVAKAAKGGGGSWIGLAFGVFFGGFGMIFVVIFFPWRLATEWELSLRGQPVSAVIVSRAETNMSINDTKVVASRFRFTAADQREYTAECYSTGPRWSEGERVAAHYLPRDPAIACVEGGRLNQAGLWAIWVVLFPFVGFGIAGWVIVSRLRVGRLLHRGEVVEVDVTDVAATNVKVNYQTVYKITVTAPTLAGGQPVTFRRWDQANVSFATQRALQKQPAFVLYDPRRPKNLIFPEALIAP